jgi:hypothetical protein
VSAVVTVKPRLDEADVLADAFEQAAGDPAVAFGPGERAFFFLFARREIVNASPRGCVFGEGAVVVAAGVVHVPVDERRVEFLVAEPVGERNFVEVGGFCGAAELERDGEFAGFSVSGENFFEALELFAIGRLESDGGLDAFLPPAIEEEALLRGEAEIALVPDSILQDAKIFKEFADVDGFGSGDRNVVRGPRVGGDFVFAPAGVAAGVVVHFEEDEVGEAAFAEAPCGAEAGDSAADDDDGEFFGFGWRGERGVVAELVAELGGFVDEGAGDGAVGFQGEADQGGARGG